MVSIAALLQSWQRIDHVRGFRVGPCEQIELGRGRVLAISPRHAASLMKKAMSLLRSITHRPPIFLAGVAWVESR
jgi:hypothetical protein